MNRDIFDEEGKTFAKRRKLHVDSKPVLNSSMDESIAENMVTLDEETPLASTSSVSSASGAQAQSPNGDKKVLELQEKLKESTKSLQTLKEEHDYYRKEKMANDKIMNDQFNSMRSELWELTTLNCKLKNNYEFKLEKIKSLESDISDCKKQIQALEERNKVYDGKITKQEQTIGYLREEIFTKQKQLSIDLVTNKNLKQQYDILCDNESRLQSEREALYSERQKQNVVLNNLDEAVRECSALRRHLQEEKDRFRDLERKTNTAVTKATEEKAEVEKLQNELKDLREQLSLKSEQLETLSKKLQEALTPNVKNKPVAKANKRAKDLEVKLELATVEIDHLKKEVETNHETFAKRRKLHIDSNNGAESNEEQLSDIYKLPNEILIDIFEYLQLKDLAALHQTSKRLQQLVNYSYVQRYSSCAGRYSNEVRYLDGYLSDVFSQHIRRLTLKSQEEFEQFLNIQTNFYPQLKGKFLKIWP